MNRKCILTFRANNLANLTTILAGYGDVGHLDFNDIEQENGGLLEVNLIETRAFDGSVSVTACLGPVSTDVQS